MDAGEIFFFRRVHLAWLKSPTHHAPRIFTPVVHIKKEMQMTVNRNEQDDVKPHIAGTDAEYSTARSTDKEVNMGNKPDKQIIDLEEFAVAGKPVPPGASYRIRIDKDQKVVEVDHMKGREILALVNKTPEKFILRQRVNGAVKPIGADETVSFLDPGVERFMTIPNEVTEGEGPQPRREFKLLKGDEAFLNSLGLRWEAVDDNGVQAVIIYGSRLPAGYNVATADVHVRFSSGYPDTQLDMAYFAPALARTNGHGINNLSTTTFDRRDWQQWSRHRTNASAWRSDIDDLSTHMALIEDWLAAELRK